MLKVEASEDGDDLVDRVGLVPAGTETRVGRQSRELGQVTGDR